MLTADEIYDATISQSVHAIVSYAESRQGKNAPFQILDLIMPKERKIRSIVGGLETSLGTTLWEPLIKRLAVLNGFKIHRESELMKPRRWTYSFTATKSKILEDRENLRGKYSASETNTAIRDACKKFIDKPISDWEKPPPGTGVDIWISKKHVDYFFDIKTVQPNKGSFKSYVKQILDWYSYFYAKYPSGKLEARIVFPYNPYSINFWEKIGNKVDPLIPIEEAWVENEFWDFVTGRKNSFQEIRNGLIYVGENDIVTNRLKKLLDS